MAGGAWIGGILALKRICHATADLRGESRCWRGRGQRWNRWSSRERRNRRQWRSQPGAAEQRAAVERGLVPRDSGTDNPPHPLALCARPSHFWQTISNPSQGPLPRRETTAGAGGLGRGQPLGEASLGQPILDPRPLGRVAAQVHAAAKLPPQEVHLLVETGDVREGLVVGPGRYGNEAGWSPPRSPSRRPVSRTLAAPSAPTREYHGHEFHPSGLTIARIFAKNEEDANEESMPPSPGLSLTSLALRR